MSICYDESSVRPGRFVSISDAKATELYLNHYSNLLLLNFIASSTLDRIERLQANKELEIARRKCSFWERHPNFNKDVALQGISKLKAQYNQKKIKETA